MAKGSGATLRFQLSRLPLLPGAERFAQRPYLTRASTSNRIYVGEQLREEGPINPILREFFFDAQTSGGLLISVPADRAQALVADLHARGVTAAVVVGEVLPREDVALVIHS
jgi:selenide,water dikinase